MEKSVWRIKVAEISETSKGTTVRYVDAAKKRRQTGSEEERTRVVLG
jgi:hypothetical protein